MSVWATNPQAAQIDALIERAGQLTSVECDRLATATARFEARFEVRFEARFEVRDAAWVAAWDAAWDAAAAAAGFAARGAADAAAALVVRDLIEEGTQWDRAAYDLLTGPWRRVIGPIHPDDEVLR